MVKSFISGGFKVITLRFSEFHMLYLVGPDLEASFFMVSVMTQCVSLSSLNESQDKPLQRALPFSWIEVGVPTETPCCAGLWATGSYPNHTESMFKAQNHGRPARS